MSVTLQHHRGTGYKYYRGRAENPVVVLVHGVGLNQDMWRPWIPVLGADFNVLTYDLLGHGHSHNPAGLRSGGDFARQLMRLVGNLGIGEFSLVGFSMGAVIAQIVASVHGTKLNRLVFLHSVYKRTDAQCAGVRYRYALTEKEGPMAAVEPAIERWFSGSYRNDNPEEMDNIRNIFSRHTDDGYLKAYCFFSYAEEEMKQYPIDHVETPALVITGSEETGSTAQMSEALARDLPNSKLIINPGHFHMAPVEHAELLAGQVLSFLNEN